jgi:hypothetical protein
MVTNGMYNKKPEIKDSGTQKSKDDIFSLKLEILKELNVHDGKMVSDETQEKELSEGATEVRNQTQT